METLKQLGPARIAVIGSVLVGLLMFFIFVSMQVSTPPLRLLYANLSSNDAASVAGKLDEANIKYEISPDSTKINPTMGPKSSAMRNLTASSGLTPAW